MPTKTTKKSTAKPATKRTPKMTAPVVTPTQHTCDCEHACACGCRCGKFKKFIVLLIVFCLGYAVARFVSCGKPGFHGPRMHPKFVEGCLDMNSIKCPKMLEELQKADVDANGCISKVEYKALRKAMRHQKYKPMTQNTEPVASEQPASENM